MANQQSSNNNLTISVLLQMMVFVAILSACYPMLPRFEKLGQNYASYMYSFCCAGAFFGSVVVSSIKHPIFSSRYFHAIMIATTCAAICGFYLWHTWCEDQARTSPQFPGLGAGVFLIGGAISSFAIAAIVSVLVPRKRSQFAIASIVSVLDPRKRSQFSVAILLQKTLFVSLVFPNFVWFPIADLISSMLRASFVQILFAGLFQSVVVSAMKHPFFSPRFWQGTVVSFILSTLGGWFVAFLICRVAANEVDSRFTYDLWTGMITSVFIATVAGGLFPRHVVVGNDKDEAVFSLATKLVAVSVCVCTICVCMIAVSLRFSGLEQFWLQALPYALLAMIAIAFRSTVSGAAISLLASMTLSVFVGFFVSKGGNPGDILILPYLSMIGCGVLLGAQMIRSERHAIPNVPPAPAIK